MKATTWTCDRCTAPIVAGRVTIAVTTGPGRLHQPEIDLCAPCWSLFGTWLGTPDAGADPAPGREVPDGDGIERPVGKHRPRPDEGRHG